jgi:hypothetical protein
MGKWGWFKASECYYHTMREKDQKALAGLILYRKKQIADIKN